MVVEEEVAVGARFVVAGPDLADRCIGQAREPLGEDAAGTLVILGIGDALAGIRVAGWPTAGPDAEAPVVGAEGGPSRHSREVPARQVGVAEPIVPGWRPEVEDLTQGRPEAIAHQLGKGLGVPRPEGEDVRPCGEGVLGGEGEVVEGAATSAAQCRLRQPDGAPLVLEDPNHGFDGPPRPHDPGVRLVKGVGDVVGADDRPPPPHFVTVQDLVPDPRLVPVVLRVLQELGPLVPHDEVGGGEEHPGQEHVLPLFVPLLPSLDGPFRPPGPEEPVGPVPVARPDTPRFPAGGRPGVRGPVLVDHRHLGAALLQVEGRPGAEGSRPHDRHVRHLTRPHPGGLGLGIDGRGLTGPGFPGPGQHGPGTRGGRFDESPTVQPLPALLHLMLPDWGSIRKSLMGESAVSSPMPTAWPFMSRM